MFILPADDDRSFLKRVYGLVWKGCIFSLAFILVLTPWTIRNYRVFGLFQPLTSQHAEMPGEFVPARLFSLAADWVDDSRFTETMLWNLDEQPIRISKIPKQAFDSPEEREQVAALLDQYNHPPGSEEQTANTDDNNPDDVDNPDDNSDESSDSQIPATKRAPMMRTQTTRPPTPRPPSPQITAMTTMKI